MAWDGEIQQYQRILETDDPALRARTLAWIKTKATDIFANTVHDDEIDFTGFKAQIKDVVYDGRNIVGMRVLLDDEDNTPVATIVIGQDRIYEPGSPFSRTPVFAPEPQAQAFDEPFPTFLRNGPVPAQRPAAPPVLKSQVRPPPATRDMRPDPSQRASSAFRDAVYKADAAWSNILQGYASALGRDLVTVGYATASATSNGVQWARDLADEDPMQATRMAVAGLAVTASVVTAVAMHNGPIPVDLSANPTLAAPAATSVQLPAIEPISATFNNEVASLPRLVLEETGIAPMVTVQARQTIESEQVINSLRNDGLRGVVDSYTHGKYFQKHAHKNTPEDQYLAHWPLRAAQGVDDMWSDPVTRHKLETAGFQSPAQIYQSVLMFADIESRFGEKLTNDVNPRVLGLFHFEENTFRSVTHGLMKQDLPLSARKDDTRIATQALVYLIVDNAKVIGNNSQRLNQRDIIRSPTLQYFSHVLGAGLGASIADMKDDMKPAHYAMHRGAAQDNHSLYFSVWGARTRDGMLDEFAERVNNARRHVADRGFDFSRAYSPTPQAAPEPHMSAAHRRVMAARAAQ